MLLFLNTRNEIRHRRQRRRFLVAVRGMLAIREDEARERSADAVLDGVDLGEGAVLVVGALDRQHRTAYARKNILDVPMAEIRMQPDVVPAAEGAVGVGVVAGETPA